MIRTKQRSKLHNIVIASSVLGIAAFGSGLILFAFALNSIVPLYVALVCLGVGAIAVLFSLCVRVEPNAKREGEC